MLRRLIIFVMLPSLVCAQTGSAVAQARLPQQHEYQRTLRKYLATLTEKDLEVPLLAPLAMPKDVGTDLAYRAWVIGAGGGGYGAPRFTELRAPANQFTLAWIESGPKVLMPPVSPSSYSWLVQWDFPFNPYRNNVPLKRRSFVALAVDLIMHDHLHESDPKGYAARSDFLGGTLIWLGYDYGVCKDVIPAEARAAYEEGLRKLTKRLQQWGPRRAMTDMDLFAPVGLFFSGRALGDPAVKTAAHQYARNMMEDRRLFHPAGYFVDVGIFDASYNGISLYFTAWGATALDSPILRDSLARAYRLKTHLMLPDPDGKLWGPTHFNPRTSGDSANDQWSWRFRDCAAAMLVDEALPCARPPTAPELATAPGALLYAFKQAIEAKPTTPAATPWGERHWTMYPVFAEQYYKSGFLERFRKLEQEKSELLVLPFRKKDSFVEAFDDQFVIAKRPGFGAVIYTGPVAGEHREWKRPLGFGGGTLSAFWTPKTGSVMLGRRRGIQGAVWDKLEEWRTWPNHAVCLLTAEGKMTTSARIQKPTLKSKVTDKGADILVQGSLPGQSLEQGKILASNVDYTRRFELSDAGLKVRTSLQADGSDKFREAYEVLPFFWRDARAQDKSIRFRILYRSGADWLSLSAEAAVKTSRLRIERFDDAVEVELDKIRSVKLSPTDWVDGFMSAATCRNVLIDLLEDRAETLGAVDLTYRIAPATP